MDSNVPPNRLQINFGFGDRNGNPNSNSAQQGQFGTADAARAFPTTPSTFPQPVFPNPTGQQDLWGAQNSKTGYGGAGYFMNNPYQTQYSMGQLQQQQQQQKQQQQPPPPPHQSPIQPQQQSQQQQSQQQPQPNYGQGPTPYRGQQGFNEAANGLVHQFSHQNLGGPPRSSSPYARQASPNQQQRPRTGGAPSQQQYGNYLSSPLPPPNNSSFCDDEPPAKTPEKYSDNIAKKAKVSTGLVSTFFKDSVQRARDRNGRALEIDQIMSNSTISDARKEQKRNNMRRAESQYLRFLRTKELPENYNTLKIIGKGAFGEVKLVQRKNDGNIYALKSLVKQEMYKKDQLAHVRSERDILAESDSPWVVKLHTTFQDNTFLYMLMEFLPGGDLMTMLIKYEIFSEDITRFYMAEITLAIEAVHKLGFIHRDIKPDNILLDRGGHIKLTDFGLSTGFRKEHEGSYYQQLLNSKPKSRDNRNSVSLEQIQLTVSNRTQINTWRKSRRQLAYSTVGTPDYIAPEIFSGKGYDYSCDWWSVGTIMFECLVGWPPFCAEDPHDTYRRIVDWQRNLHFPPEQPLSREAEGFIRSLVCDVDNRLGRLGGAHEIKQHPFFRGVDWAGLRKIRAPFEPKLQSSTDTQHFPIDEIDQNDHSAMLRAQNAQASDEYAADAHLPFSGYTYKRFDMYRGS